MPKEWNGLVERLSGNMCACVCQQDAESLKVGVADMITQWVKGNPDGTSRSSPSRPAVSLAQNSRVQYIVYMGIHLLYVALHFTSFIHYRQPHYSLALASPSQKWLLVQQCSKKSHGVSHPL